MKDILPVDDEALGTMLKRLLASETRFRREGCNATEVPFIYLRQQPNLMVGHIFVPDSGIWGPDRGFSLQV